MYLKRGEVLCVVARFKRVRSINDVVKIKMITFLIDQCNKYKIKTNLRECKRPIQNIQYFYNYTVLF